MVEQLQDLEALHKKEDSDFDYYDVLEARDSAINPSVIGYRLPWGNPPKNRRRDSVPRFCQHDTSPNQYNTHLWSRPWFGIQLIRALRGN